MKTLIIFGLYVTFVKAKYRGAIEIYEIKKTNDNNQQMFVKNHNAERTSQIEATKLWKFLLPSKTQDSLVEKAKRDLLEKLNYNSIDKRKKTNNQDIVFVKTAKEMSGNDDDGSDERDSFVYESRSGHQPFPEVLYVFPRRNAKINKLPIQPRASNNNGDRTAEQRQLRYQDEE